MTKLGIRLATKIIAPDVKVRFSQIMQTCYIINSNTVMIGNDFLNDDGFTSHIRDSHFYDKVDALCIGMWTLLHEIGHSRTIDNFDSINDEVFEASAPYMSSNDLFSAHYNAPIEFEATEWAISWVSTHPMLARLLNKLINF